ncbi:hypothetical protein G6F32_016865 [Rhizopus arrhizus]|nr:hypothetical protein G6F32_016865 [Rhizopus arrhizus]
MWCCCRWPPPSSACNWASLPVRTARCSSSSIISSRTCRRWWKAGAKASPIHWMTRACARHCAARARWAMLPTPSPRPTSANTRCPASTALATARWRAAPAG